MRLLSKLYLGGNVDCARHDLARFLRRERDAKTAVYNYAARLGYHPQIHTSLVPNGSAQRYSCTVQLPGRGTSVRATAATRDWAEVFACAKFRRSTRRLQIGHSPKHSDSPHRVFRGLTAPIAPDFVKAYSEHNRDSRFTVHAKQDGSHEWLASAYVDGHCIQDQILAATERAALDLGYLVLAVNILKERPLLWEQFRSKSYSRSDTDSLAWRAVSLKLKDSQKDEMRTVLVHANNLGLQSLSAALKEVGRPRPGFLPMYARIPAKEFLQHHSEELQRRAFESISQVHKAEANAKTPNDLLVRQSSLAILQTVQQNDISVICGPFCGGKTTQIPQLLLEEQSRNGGVREFKMLCVLHSSQQVMAQARVIARQRNEPLGQSVGYEYESGHIIPNGADGSLIFCSTSFLTTQLARHAGAALDTLSHLMLDDAKFESPEAEMLMTLLKKALDGRKKDGQSSCKLVFTHSSTPGFSDALLSYFSAADSKYAKVELCDTGLVPAQTVYLENICDTLGALYSWKHLALVHHDKRYLEMERDFMIQSLQTRQPKTADTEWVKIEMKDGTRKLSSKFHDHFEEEPYDKDEAMVPLRLAAVVLGHIVRRDTEKWSILVFLPSIVHVNRLREILLKKKPLGVSFDDPYRFEIITLNSQPTKVEEFHRPPNTAPWRWRILLATSFAEDMVVIPRLKYVIDLGKTTHHTMIDHQPSLQTTWMTRSNLQRRMQRATASRIPNAQYIALFTESRERCLTETPASYSPIDILKSCMLLKTSTLLGSLEDFFEATPTPPPRQVVRKAITDLIDLDILTENEEMTSLGLLVHRLNLEPARSKAILHGAALGCLTPMLVLAAAVDSSSLFSHLPETRVSGRLRFAGDAASDHMAIYNAFLAMQRAQSYRDDTPMADYAKLGLRHAGFISVQYKVHSMARALKEVQGDVPSPGTEGVDEDSKVEFGVDINSENKRLTEALLLSGSPHSIAFRVSPHRYINAQGEECILNAASAAHAQDDKIATTRLVFFSRSSVSSHGRGLVLHEVSQIQPMAALLFGGSDLMVVDDQTLEIDNWLRFRFSTLDPEAMQAIVELRKGLHHILRVRINSLASGESSAQAEQVHEVFAQALLKMLSWNLVDVEAVSTSASDELGDDETDPLSGSSFGFGFSTPPVVRPVPPSMRNLDSVKVNQLKRTKQKEKRPRATTLTGL